MTRMIETSFIAIGNDELTEPLGDSVICYVCGASHPVTYGRRIMQDGSRVPDRSAAFVQCRGKTYLVGVDGKRWRP